MKDAEGLQVECLRPLVDSKEWDYCVVWRLGHDPSRFIQWLGCCCGGATDYKRDSVNRVKEESAPVLAFCKDVMYKHPSSSKACKALAQLPSFFPLYSGVHDEVVAAQKPKWTYHTITLPKEDPSASTASVGTRVFIPAPGGLVELFAAKPIVEDWKIVECITSLWTAQLKQETVMPKYYADLRFNRNGPDQLVVDEKLHNLPSLYRLLSRITPSQVLPTVTKPSTYSSLLEGSSSCSHPSNEHPPFDSCSERMLDHRKLTLAVAKPSGSRKSRTNEKLRKQQAIFLPSLNHKVAKSVKMPERDGYKSRNLETERNRRKKINSRLLELRALVPKISKMDKISILGDAAEYIEELDKEVKILQDELRELGEKEESNEKNSKMPAVKLEAFPEGSRNLQDQPRCSFAEQRYTEVEPEVNQINQREYLVKFLGNQRRGGVASTLDSIHTLGIQIMDANVTTINGKVLYILKVQANKDIEAKKLRESLLHIARTVVQKGESRW